MSTTQTTANPGGGGSGGGTWGSIAGTLANQLDLQSALDAKATTAALTTHTGDTANPHAVTKAQVGLTNVDDTSDATKNAATATLTNKTLDSFTNEIAANELHIEVRNASGSTILKGTPVYITGYDPGTELVTVGPADASVAATMPAIGLTEEEILNNATGPVINIGRISGVDTSAFAVGAILYVSETAGTLTTTAPTGAAIIQHIGTVYRSHAVNGVIGVTAESAIVPAASETTPGVVELATVAEAQARTDTTRAITAAGMAAALLAEVVYAIPSSTTPAISPANGTIQTWTLTGNSTPTAGTWNTGESMTLMIDDGTAYTVTWFTVTWVGGVVPTLATSGYTFIDLWKVGTTIYAAFAGYAA